MKNYLNYSLSKKFAHFLDAKELEFKSDVRLFVDKKSEIISTIFLDSKICGEYEQSYTFDDGIDFFIEKFGIHIETEFMFTQNRQMLTIKKVKPTYEELINKSFDTKHEAIEYGIEKVIEILTEKENE